MENDPHGAFLDHCMFYGDTPALRPVFFGAIWDFFIRAASKEELSQIRKAVRAREKALKQGGGKRGRPRGLDDEKLLWRARVIAWRRIVQGWTWKRIAEEEGLDVSDAVKRKQGERTVQRRMDFLAANIWRALPFRADDSERLKVDLEAKTIQRWLRSKTGLPFHSHPEECKKIVLGLAPRGLQAVVEITDRLSRSVTRSRKQ